MGECEVKTVLIFSAALALAASANASAQQAVQCPSLPASSGLHWEQQTQSDFIVCKATTEDGRAVLNMMLSGRDPGLSLNRPLRAEKGAFGGTEMHWYKLDMGGRDLPGLESRRISVVKLDKNRYAQIWIDAADTTELGTLQTLTQTLNLNPSALAGSN
ncbi:MAG: hypothetical protein DI584_17790 [Stenotrophomonas sp.]|jgi:hypothetical protein|nr:MAG: hypothetical protein DI584_17790 [Stenotrophomonas sp.]